MDINFQNKKIELIQWLSTLNDETVIDKIIKLRESEKIDWWKGISEDEKIRAFSSFHQKEVGKKSNCFKIK